MRDDERYAAVVACDSAFDGQFFYAVRTTGIFCRPSCPSKPPLRGHIAFYPTAAEALRAGFRPCKRCRPELLDYSPDAELAIRAKAAIDSAVQLGEPHDGCIAALGIGESRLRALFKARFGMTHSAYARALRLEKAKQALRANAPIADVAYGAGYRSVTAFYRAFHRAQGISPAAYRRLSAKENRV